MTDYKAKYGYQPTWKLQREKQDEAAHNYYERIHGEVVNE